MQVAEFNHEDFQSNNQAEQDKTLLVKFYVKSRQDKARTVAEGRPIFKDVEYIHIMIPGSRDGAARPATHRDRQRFPKHYQAFKERIELPEEGTPLAEWGTLTRSTVEELAFFNIKTVEQLANVNDNVASQFMGCQGFKSKAKAYLEVSKRDVSLNEMQLELTKRDDQIKDLRNALDELKAQIEEEYED